MSLHLCLPTSNSKQINSDVFNLKRIQDIVSRIEIHNFFMSVKLSAEESKLPGRVRLVADYSLPDNYDRQCYKMNFHLTNDETRLDAPENIVVRAARNLVALIMLHELDERLYLDDKRFYDPHHKSKTDFVCCLCPEFPCEHLK